MQVMSCGRFALIILTVLVSACGGGSSSGGSSNGNVSTPKLMGGAIQGTSLNLNAQVTTFGSYTSAYSITTDGTNLYVTGGGTDYKISKIVIATGAVTTLAGSGAAGSTDATGTAASFNYPYGITTDGTSVFVADLLNNKIRKVEIATGIVSTLAGSGVSGSTDATGTAATFNFPSDLTTDGVNLYVSEFGNRKIRKIVIATGVVTTLAGSGVSGSTDATGTSASFTQPYGITTDGVNVYVADNYKIRQIVIATSVVTTLAGSGVSNSVDGTGTSASFVHPDQMTSDGTNLYLADSVSGSGFNTIRKIVISTGVVTTLAGSSSPGSTNGTGVSALFNGPSSITSDGSSLYVADLYNNQIRKIQ